ncbi:hypothetical protein NO559_03170 [Dasania sp. GY-MA-18]|uniref:Uncharacterized protein n=1 Tax=Dasania phycosphaerae TaxID=2950436 RepID=A0A9J6RIV7_9GAMM|nr:MULTISPECIES: hypothetical protein [Dasania]MCR8921756.1 hypothetical protein [Dasania sp. GY-MA-18]MCZ0864184.1 hypothetical protein [Dasania phycosphaerae]MCZ0867912.1 hypothetical protein [Dasania phycosphaerae]
MNYLIIVIIMAVVIGPIMWMMPSARQRQQMAVRQYALAQGFTIKVTDLPQSHRQRVRKEPVKQGVVYRLPLQQDRPLVMSQVYCLSRGIIDDVQEPQSTDYEWQGQPLNEAETWFTEALQQCPRTAVAIEYSAAGVGCYWQERGGEAAVEQIKVALQQLRKQLKQLKVSP